MKSFRGRESRAGTTQGESGLHLKGQRLTVHPHPEPRGTCLRSVTQQPGGSLPFGCLANKPLLSPGKTRQAGGGDAVGKEHPEWGTGDEVPPQSAGRIGVLCGPESLSHILWFQDSRLSVPAPPSGKPGSWGWTSQPTPQLREPTCALAL